MGAIRFLSNDSLWSELRARVKKARSVKAAVAFLGTGGADLLPLKKGDTLVVNLGMPAVKQGSTAPREIRRLQRRGVHVFTRTSLHAKFFICDRALLVGSANASKNSKNSLDEAAALTTDVASVRRATAFFDRLCTEPVRPEYLNRCLKAYRPPKFTPIGHSTVAARQQRVIEAKLWFIGGLRFYDVPEAEKTKVERIQLRAKEQLKKSKGTSVDTNHYPKWAARLSHLRIGDWIINCIRDSDGNRHVYAPQQVLGLENYPRGQGKKRYLLLSEAPDAGQAMTLASFRRRVRSLIPELDSDCPRTRPIANAVDADAILRIWTPGGRLAK